MGTSRKWVSDPYKKTVVTIAQRRSLDAYVSCCSGSAPCILFDTIPVLPIVVTVHQTSTRATLGTAVIMTVSKQADHWSCKRSSDTCSCYMNVGMGYVILLWHSLSLPYNYFIHIAEKPRQITSWIHNFDANRNLLPLCSCFQITFLL